MCDVCPVSNVRTRVVTDLESHPLPAMLAAGVACSISTDDPAMFETDLTHEYEVAAGLGVSARAAFDAGVRGALCDDETRAQLRAARPDLRLGRGAELSAWKLREPKSAFPRSGCDDHDSAFGRSIMQRRAQIVARAFHRGPLVATDQMLSEVLSDFARTFLTDFSIEAILDHVVERIVAVLRVSAAGVTLISAGLAPCYVAASDERALEFERLQTEIAEGPCVAVFESGEAVAIPNLANDDRFPRFGHAVLRGGLAAVFTFPLRHQSGTLGALDLYRDTPGKLDAFDMSAAQTLADVTAAYLLNAQARDDARAVADRLYDISLHDPLTGLPNRLLLRARLKHAAERAERSHADAAVLFADLDNFKSVNDTYGHQIGDELLIAVAIRLSGLVRPGDTLARISGDEFVFLCEDLRSAVDVDTLARRIDSAFAEPFVVSGAVLTVTASVGIAFVGPGEVISERLVARADRAMYETKRRTSAGHRIIDLRERPGRRARISVHDRDKRVPWFGKVCRRTAGRSRPGTGQSVR